MSDETKDTVLRVAGLKDLIIDAVDGTTRLVERTHESVAARYVDPLLAIEPIADPVRLVDTVRRIGTAGVYSTIRLVNFGVGLAAEVGIAVAGHAMVASERAAESRDRRPSPETGEQTGEQDDEAAKELPVRRRGAAVTSPLGWFADAAQGALNGFVGDYLEKRGNGLGIRMTFRKRGRELPADRESFQRAISSPSRKVAVFVHGLSCTEQAWNVFAERFHGDSRTTFATLLERDLGYTPLFIRYNTGLHVSENGKKLAALLTELEAAYPVPIEELVLLGHSMGGLVARSAAHYGCVESRAWMGRLQHVFCIGAPHLGAPLEKAVNVLSYALSRFDTPGTQIPAELLNNRSAGIKDLRFGYTTDEEWKDKDPDALLEDNRCDVPFVDGVSYCFISSTLHRDPKHPLGDLLGDLLVRPASAAGRCQEPARHLSFRVGKVFGGMHHFHLCNHPDVYEQLRSWLESDAAKPALLGA
jgi:pimeloyl-ACP methyl ester carboxylesterase